MSSFLNVEDLVVDDVYKVVGYKKFYYMGYNYVIKITKDEGVTYKYMLISDGSIYDKLNSVCTTSFNIKKANIEIGKYDDGRPITLAILITVEDSEWKTLANNS